MSFVEDSCCNYEVSDPGEEPEGPGPPLFFRTK